MSESKPIDVLVVGELNLDLILNDLESFPEIGKEKLAHKMTLTLGSSSAIFASNLSALGARVGFLGKIGEDRFGTVVTESLENKRVGTDFIIISPEEQTGLTVVLNAGNDRAMVTYPGAMTTLGTNEISDEQILSARHLHVSSIFLQPALKPGLVKLFQRAHDLGLSTSLDTQWDPDEKWELDLDHLLPNVDVFLPNELEFRYLTGTSDLDKAIKKLPSNRGLVIVKQGEHGSSVIDGERKYKIEPYLNKKVADAIGAGDSFDAGYIFKYLQGKDPETCAAFGNLMGALNTTAPGGTGAFTDYEHIMKSAKEKFTYSGEDETTG